MEEDLMVINEEKFEDLANKLSTELSLPITPINVYNALFMVLGDKHDMFWNPDVYDLNIDFDEAFTILVKFDFSSFQNEIFSDQEVIKGMELMERKILIKASGIVWTIHQNDIDPFPSDPHAHQIGENIKLDLSNGNCYRQKRLLGTIHKKELLKIREQAEIKFKGRLRLPPLKIA